MEIKNISNLHELPQQFFFEIFDINNKTSVFICHFYYVAIPHILLIFWIYSILLMQNPIMQLILTWILNFLSISRILWLQTSVTKPSFEIYFNNLIISL